MGKKKSVQVRGGGSFVVKGKKITLTRCNPDTIAEFLEDAGYPAGTRVKWNGGGYQLLIETGIERVYRLVRVA